MKIEKIQLLRERDANTTKFQYVCHISLFKINKEIFSFMSTFLSLPFNYSYSIVNLERKATIQTYIEMNLTKSILNNLDFPFY